jgi:hypothetical protein
MENNSAVALKWDAALQCWEGEISLSSPEPFRLSVFARDVVVSAITSQAHLAMDRVRQLESECRLYAANQLLETLNQGWAEDGPITTDEFVRRLVPDSIVVHESGYTEVYFSDDDMFWGHLVAVRIKPDGTFQEALIEG